MGTTLTRVIKIGGLLAVAAVAFFIVGVVGSGGNSVNGWTIAGVWCIVVYAVSVLAASFIDRRREDEARRKQ